MKQFLIVAVFAAVLCGPAAEARGMQQKDPKGAINVTPEEAKAYEPIEKAATPDAALTAAQAFMAKYPKSAALPQVEIAVYNKILDAPADEKRISLIGSFKQAFPASDRTIQLERTMVDYHTKAGQEAEARRILTAYTTKFPDEVDTHFDLLFIAAQALQRGDDSQLKAGIEHGRRAIELLEPAAKPATFVDDAQWTTYRTGNRPKARQFLGLLLFASGDASGAEATLNEAIAIDANDPQTYSILAALRQTEYVDAAQKFNASPDKKSPEAQQALEKANGALDRLLMTLAKFVVLAEARPEYKGAAPTMRAELEDLYKQRHGGKTDGLDGLLKAAREKK